MDEDYRDFPPNERPDVEILVDGTWYAGELHAWALRDGIWWGHVTYRTGPSQQHRATVPHDRIREAPDPPPRP